MGFSCPFLGRKVAKAIKIQDNSYTLGICSYHSMSFLKRKGFFFSLYHNVHVDFHPSFH